MNDLQYADPIQFPIKGVAIGLFVCAVAFGLWSVLGMSPDSIREAARDCARERSIPAPVGFAGKIFAIECRKLV